MNPLLENPVFILTRGTLSDANATAKLLSGGAYCLTTALYRGPAGNFRAGAHGSRLAVFAVSDELAADLERNVLLGRAAHHERQARNARFSETECREEREEGDPDVWAAEAEEYEQAALALRERIAKLELASNAAAE